MSRYGDVKSGQSMVREYQFYVLTLHHFCDVTDNLVLFLRWFDVKKSSFMVKRRTIETGTELTPSLQRVLHGFPHVQPFAPGAIKDWIISMIDDEVRSDFWRVADAKIRRDNHDYQL